MKSFRDLIAWQKSMTLVTQIYSITRDFPDDERFGLTSQIRRSAVSVPSNIAEGYGRNSTRDYVRFLQIASGSLYELQTQLEIGSNLGYLAGQNFQTALDSSNEVGRILSGLIRSISSSERGDSSRLREDPPLYEYS